MIMIALCGSLIGAVLGTRFKVQVLYPAAMVGFVVVAAIAAFKGSTITSTMVAEIIYAISLQVGYLGGLFTRFCMAATRVRSHRSVPSAIAES